jgi:hypothetical protein
VLNIFLRLLVDYLKLPFVKFLSFLLSSVFEKLFGIEFGRSPHFLVSAVFLFGVKEPISEILILQNACHVSSCDLQLGIFLVILAFSGG